MSTGIELGIIWSVKLNGVFSPNVMWSVNTSGEIEPRCSPSIFVYFEEMQSMLVMNCSLFCFDNRGSLQNWSCNAPFFTHNSFKNTVNSNALQQLKFGKNYELLYPRVLYKHCKMQSILAMNSRLLLCHNRGPSRNWSSYQTFWRREVFSCLADIEAPVRIFLKVNSVGHTWAYFPFGHNLVFL